ncbi:hypothetical protein HMPREF9135_1711 [Segatella baroniae F0067]|uniref:Uncharacterized protein n=1 Tax=Segatella baroniae F0067 TaxID=1115809 RepID=U2QKP3_9BACT|nr:hypothetical protein HMPREF9135_1711 [Segatella baroniae F0067]
MRWACRFLIAMPLAFESSPFSMQKLSFWRLKGLLSQAQSRPFAI